MAHFMISGGAWNKLFGVRVSIRVRYYYYLLELFCLSPMSFLHVYKYVYKYIFVVKLIYYFVKRIEAHFGTRKNWPPTDPYSVHQFTAINPLGTHLFEIFFAHGAHLILWAWKSSRFYAKINLFHIVHYIYYINKNEHVKYCLSFNDVSERHVRLWPNKRMTFWYVNGAQRVKLKCSSSEHPTSQTPVT